jgi:ATP-dependent metalloprotease
LLARLDVYMGGRYAEEVSFGSTGVTSSESDLFLATSLATAMVTRYGMSSKLGPVSHIVDSGRSSKTQVTIEEEVKKMLEQAYKNAKAVVDKHRKELYLLAHALMEHETLSDHRVCRCEVRMKVWASI